VAAKGTFAELGIRDSYSLNILSVCERVLSIAATPGVDSGICTSLTPMSMIVALDGGDMANVH
jgi:hypothetical protein